VFVLGSSIYHPLISLPKQKGIKLSLVEDRERKLALNTKKQRANKKKKKKKKKKTHHKKKKRAGGGGGVE
jgi:CelD/BcsL family acetyltransferase involved in cellulose biosynthesis